MEKKNNVMIIGDSYSTYGGYIPEGYYAYYSDAREDAPVVKGVEKTWWHQLMAENNLSLILNDSYSGSTICNTVRENFSVETSFIRRIDRYIAENFFTENKIDTLFIFGGTNDSWINAPVGETKYADWTEDDLKCVLPAFCYLVSRAKASAGKVICMVNTDLKPEITSGFIEACEKIDVECLVLKEIEKEKGHPTVLGMKQICDQVSDCLQGN